MVYPAYSIDTSNLTAKDLSPAAEEVSAESTAAVETERQSGDEKDVFSADVHVNEEEYYLGSGDELTAYIWGGEEKQLDITVTSSGKVMIPTVGPIDIRTITLDSAKTRIRKKISRIYRAERIDVVLSEIKTLKVPVYGEVQKEEVFYVSGAMRLSALLKKLNLTERASLRDVCVKNRQRGTEYYDMVSVQRDAPGAVDPYLYSGDRVFISVEESTVSVLGAVHYPGSYSYVEGETLDHLIALTGGYARGADSSSVTVYRFLDERDSLEYLEITPPEFKSFVLKRDDRVVVQKINDYREHRSVTIHGEVNNPGKYPIRDDKTRLVEIIARAGGLTEKAYLGGSRIVRKKFIDAGENEFSRLQSIMYSELSPSEKNYLKYRKTTSNSGLSIDFQKLKGAFGDSSGINTVYDIVLRDGDDIYIAQRGLSVNVMGAVVRPGLVRFEKGEEIQYYINKAGGFSEDAKKRDIQIIKGGTETWLDPKDVDRIDVGDAIWIPEQEYVDAMEQTKDILSILGGIASIVTASITVMKYVDGQ
ncbi:MAG: SLBB domain-containing protein [Fibrobacterota bacterium]